MLKKRLITLGICYAVPLYLETMLRLLTIGELDIRFLYTVAFCIPLAGVLFFTTVFTDKLPMKIVFNVLIAAMSIWCCVHLVYYTVFKGFLSISSVGLGGDALANFSSQVWFAILQSLLGLIVLIIPVAVCIVFTFSRFNYIHFGKMDWRLPCLTALGILLTHIICVLSLYIGGTIPYTVYDAYHSSSVYTDASVRNLGIFVTTRLEVQQTVLRWFNIDSDRMSDDEKKTLDALVKDPYEDTGDKDLNAFDIDFEALKELTADSEIASTITETFEKRKPTETNEYTGMFEGYNLITICAEAFSPYLISEELTPTLYKLANEGFVFENFYGSFESMTTNGEYAFCMGMFPDLSRNKSDTSFMATETNTLPYTLGSMFQSIGVPTYAYHNNVGTFYERYLTHPNMGYDVFKTPDAGLDMEIDWPSSDLDMFVASVDDYISSGEQFHAYYMTFSGHYQYSWDNPMSAKHRDKVSHLAYSEAVASYIACNLDLEYGLQYLMERLEEEGIADKTVIVLTTDHYPYGLTSEEYNELAGKNVDTDFDRFRNSFICWSGSMEEPVKIEKLCCTIDILPTLLNLFGFEFDSRFIVGRDIMSATPGLAILSNQSFITDDYMFNAVDNELTVLTEEDIPEEDINHMKSFVRGTLELSRSILKSDYYRYLQAHLNGETELPPKSDVPEKSTNVTASPSKAEKP